MVVEREEREFFFIFWSRSKEEANVGVFFFFFSSSLASSISFCLSAFHHYLDPNFRTWMRRDSRAAGERAANELRKGGKRRGEEERAM